MAGTEAAAVTHIYFVLDRSGSMESIRSDVIGGFNAFLAEQQEDDDALFTLVQFDSQDAFEVVADAVPVREMTKLDAASFVPRGGTPLFDAMGRTIGKAASRAALLKDAGAAAEDVLFVTFTDGAENQSSEHDRDSVFAMVKQKEADGWTFVYMSANQDAYAEGGRMGYAGGGTQAYAADAAGTEAAFRSLSKATKDHRARRRLGDVAPAAPFFEDKEAEDDLKRRKGGDA